MKHEIEHRTQRRTRAEIELAERIEALAKKKKPNPAAFGRAARASAAAKRSPRYEYNRGFSVIDQLPIRYFHKRGDSVVGVLGEPGQELWFGSTYPLKLDDGRVIRLPSNRLLHKRIQEADAIGVRVKITYDGKLYYRYGGHYQKAYTIELLDGHAPTGGEPTVAAIAAAAGVEVPRRTGQPKPLFETKRVGNRVVMRREQPIALTKTKAREILEASAAAGDPGAAQMLKTLRARDEKRRRKEGRK
jgi:hypothetical protein